MSEPTHILCSINLVISTCVVMIICRKERAIKSKELKKQLPQWLIEQVIVGKSDGKNWYGLLEIVSSIFGLGSEGIIHDIMGKSD